MNTIKIRSIHGLVFLPFLFCILVGLSSCAKESIISPNDDDVYTTTLPDYDDSPSNSTDINTSDVQEMPTLVTPPSDNRSTSEIGFRTLRRLLNLSSSQKRQIKEYAKSHKDLFKEVLDSLRDSEKTIYQGYRIQFEAIRTARLNGTIDSATAKAQRQDLLGQLRQSLRDNPVRSWAKEQLKSIRNTFITQVKSVLTPEQLSLFDEWVQQHKR